MKRFGSIYKITRISDGKAYVGKTTRDSVMDRFNDHYWKTSSKMYIDMALRKYGRGAFKVEELFIAFSEQSLNEAEYLLVKAYNTLSPDGFNLKDGGHGGTKHTPLARKRISDGIKRSAKIFKPGFNRPHTEQTKQQISRKFSQEKIVAICLKTGAIKIYDMLMDVKNDGFHKSNVVQICKKRSARQMHKAHTFMYYSDYVNQNGSVDIKMSIHVQRIGIDPSFIS
jgi:group I intron endonuclease